MRARWTILKTGHTVELREVDLKNKPEELIKVSSKATVPVLITSDGTVIDESLEIMKWFLRDFNIDFSIISFGIEYFAFIGLQTMVDPVLSKSLFIFRASIFPV